MTPISMYYLWIIILCIANIFFILHTRFVEKALYSHELWKGFFLIMSYEKTYEFEFFVRE